MRRFLIPTLAAVISLGLAVPPAVANAGEPRHDGALQQYAAGTWASFVAMTYSQTGLPADSLGTDGSRSVQTSTTNIGAYMWSAVVAEDLGIINRRELVSRLSTTLQTLEHMERHQASGQFYNWYDASTGAKLTVWPPTGEPLSPILSSVDNGWLATGLRVVRGAVPELADQAGELYDSMNFSIYYRADKNQILFFYPPSPGNSGCCYDTSFLGLRWNRSAVLTNLDNLRRNFDIYSKWGFRDSVNVQTGKVSPFYLSLDQGIIMASIGNELGHDVMRRAFAGRDMQRLVQPVISVETFNDRP